jgi:hypothetical protein
MQATIVPARMPNRPGKHGDDDEASADRLPVSAFRSSEESDFKQPRMRTPKYGEVTCDNASESSFDEKREPNDAKSTGFCKTESEKKKQKQKKQKASDRNINVMADEDRTKTEPSVSHRERHRAAAHDDESTVGVMLDDDEVPGAHSIPGSMGGRHHGSNAVTHQDPESNDIHHEQEPVELQASGASVVSAWMVEEAVSAEENQHVEGTIEQKPELPQAIVQKGFTGWIRGHLALSACVMTALLIAALVVPLSILLSKDDPVPVQVAPAPGNITVTAPNITVQIVEVLQVIFVGAVTPGDEASFVGNLSESQSEALNWLANEDDFLDFETADPVLVIERYALASIYFATKGWTDPFVTEFDHCEWYQGYSYAVSCDEKGYVTGLNLNGK